VRVGSGRRKTNAAVAHHNRGDSMPARGTHLRVPSNLAVVMRVNVYPAGQHREARSVDLALASANNDAHFGDDSVIDSNVTHEGWRPGAVDDVSASDHDVMHRASL